LRNAQNLAWKLWGQGEGTRTWHWSTNTGKWTFRATASYTTIWKDGVELE
jgi:hypothetical protein